MHKLYGLFVLALFLVVGCGKKSEPEEATGPAVSADLARLVVIRNDARGTTETATYRSVLSVTNGHSGDITLKTVVYSGSMGPHPVERARKELGFTVAAGATSEIKLDSEFTWKDEAPIRAQMGTVTGTLFYRGPNGGDRQLPFTLDGELTIRGD